MTWAHRRWSTLRTNPFAHTPLISVIDDDGPFRVAMDSLLRARGYAVHTFASVEFLWSPQLDEASCVITDVQMSDISGLHPSAQPGTHRPDHFHHGIPRRIGTRTGIAGRCSVLLGQAIRRMMPGQIFVLGPYDQRLRAPTFKQHWRSGSFSIEGSAGEEPLVLTRNARDPPDLYSINARFPDGYADPCEFTTGTVTRRRAEAACPLLSPSKFAGRTC